VRSVIEFVLHLLYEALGIKDGSVMAKYCKESCSLQEPVRALLAGGVLWNVRAGGAFFKKFPQIYRV
jgi:hypothetical protein